MKKTEKIDLIEQTRTAALARNTARLGELGAEIRRRMTGVVESFYDIGEALREIIDKKLYAAAGHASMDAFLEAEGLLSPRQARKLVAVARRVSRPTALTLGQERAYALLSYAQVTEAPDSVSTLVAENAVINGKPVVESSLREIEAATRAARTERRAQRPKTDVERERTRTDQALVKAVREALRVAGITRAEVTVGRQSVHVELTRAQVERLAHAA